MMFSVFQNEQIVMADTEPKALGGCKVRFQYFSDNICYTNIEEDTGMKAATKKWSDMAATTDVNECVAMKDANKFYKAWCNWGAFTVGVYTDEKCTVLNQEDN